MSEIEFDKRELQLKLCDILYAVAKICEEHDIRYYLDGGTTLGAVRHKGFIPWDDDIDIVMPRPDFEYFLKIANEKLPEYYEVRTHKTHPGGHVYPWAKIEDGRTTVVVDWQRHLNYKGGIFIDLFPLDGLPGNKIIRKWYMNLILFLSRKLLSISYIDINKYEKKGIKLCIVKFLHWDICRSGLHHLIHALLRCYKYDKCKYVANCIGEYGLKNIMKKEFYGIPVYKEFEGNLYRVPEKYDLYLKQLYGNIWNFLLLISVVPYIIFIFWIYLNPINFRYAYINSYSELSNRILLGIC